MFRWIFTPVAVWISAAVLVACVAGLEVERNHRSLLWHTGLYARRTGCYFPRYVYALHTDAGWRLYDDEALERDRAAAQRVESRASRVITADYYARSWRLGVLACTEEHVVQALRLGPGYRYESGAAVTADEAAEVRSALVDYLQEQRWRVPPRESLRRGDIDESHTLWFGWVHNVALALSLSVCGSALACWLPTAVRFGRFPPPGCCAHCGYSLAGLPGPRCPECGTINPA